MSSGSYGAGGGGGGGGHWRRKANENFHAAFGHVATNYRTGDVMAEYMNRMTGLPIGTHIGRTRRSGSYVHLNNMHGSWHPLGPESHTGMIHTKRCPDKYTGKYTEACRITPSEGTMRIKSVGAPTTPKFNVFTNRFAEAVMHATHAHPGPSKTIAVGSTASAARGAGGRGSSRGAGGRGGGGRYAAPKGNHTRRNRSNH